MEEPSCFRFRAVRQFEREAGHGCFESLEDVASVQFKVPLNIQSRVWRVNNNQDLLSACPESDSVLRFLLALTYLIVTAIRLCKRCFHPILFLTNKRKSEMQFGNLLWVARQLVGLLWGLRSSLLGTDNLHDNHFYHHRLFR